MAARNVERLGDAFRLPEWRPGNPSPHRKRSPAHAHGAGLLHPNRWTRLLRQTGEK